MSPRQVLLLKRAAQRRGASFELLVPGKPLPRWSPPWRPMWTIERDESGMPARMVAR